MKQVFRALFVLFTLLVACLLAGCGKSDQADPKAGTPPAQTKAEGERVQNGQAEHYQEMQQHKQQGSGGQ